MAKEDVIRQVVYPDPFDRLCCRGIPLCSISRIKVCILVQFHDLVSSVYLISIWIKKSWSFFITLDRSMTIETNIYRWNCGDPAFPGIAMTVQATYLINARMYFMRKVDRLRRFVRFLPTSSNRCFRYKIAYADKNY